MGRKSIPILLKPTSPEGETKTFTSIGEAVKELGFSERGIGKAYHEKKNRIGKYSLEWLASETYEAPKLDDSIISTRIEGLKKAYNFPNCIYCHKPMTREDRVKNGFGIYEIDEKTGHIKTFNEVRTIYKGNKLTGLSTRALRNAADKGNVMITRRKDKKKFILSWQTIHEWCF